MLSRSFFRFLSFLLLWQNAAVLAQDTIQLGTFHKIDSVQQPYSGSLHYQISPEFLSNSGSASLADALAFNSGFFFKQSTPGMLSTPSWRGGDANHTLLMWNGAKLNAPTLGSTDFSTIPATSFQCVEVFSNASSNSFASGGLGGGIALNNLPQWRDKFVNASFGAGSFQTNSVGLDFNQPFVILKQRMNLAGSLSSIKSANSFSFWNIYNNRPYQREIMEHAGFNRQNILLSLTWPISKAVSIQSNLWCTSMHRELPYGINNKNSSLQSQRDSTLRAQAIFKYIPNERWSASYNLTYERNLNAYSDPRTSIYNRNRFQSAQNILNFSYKPAERILLSSSIVALLVNATSENYSKPVDAQVYSAMLKCEFIRLLKCINIDLGVRAEKMNDIEGVGPTAAISYLPSKSLPLKIFINGSRSFRIPTLNELYWNPGGNINLKPEIVNAFELGADYAKGNNELKLAFYRGLYADRIRWIPQGQLFTPINIVSSKSSGVDLHIEKSIQLHRMRLSVFQNTALMSAQGLFGSDSLWYALSYVPNLVFNGGFRITWKNVKLDYQHQFVTSRYITNDESAYMPGYNLANAGAVWHNRSIQLGLIVSNIWNTNYQNLPWFPMPGRGFSMQLTVLL